jgi:hypothetical protein
VVVVAGACAEFPAGVFCATPVASIAIDSAPAAEIAFSCFQFITLTSFLSLPCNIENPMG